MRFTQAAVHGFKPPVGKTDHIEFDDAMPGFGLRVQAGGSKVYIIQYKIGTKSRRLSLGNAAKVTLESARDDARQKFAMVARKVDPANERAKRNSNAVLAFGSVADDFLAIEKAKRKPSSFEARKRYLKHHWKPLHGLALADIERANVARQLHVIAKENGPVSADSARGALSRFFNWAIGEGLCESSPVDGTNKAAGDRLPRDRVLTDKELAAIWSGLEDDDFGCIVRLLALTGQRRSEIGSLRWSEIDLNAKLISLPKDRTKNELAHDIPLSAAALQILQAIPQPDGRIFVFGRTDSAGFLGWGNAKDTLDAKVGAMERWTLHDLRRTAATRMGDLGVQPHVVEAVLNHISGSKRGVAGIYNRAVYANEKRAALDTLAQHIMKVTGQLVIAANGAG